MKLLYCALELFNNNTTLNLFMKNFLTALLLLGSVSQLFGQSGYYFQSHFSPIKNRRDQISYSIEQDDWGRLYLANRQGLLHFDGSNWDVINAPGPTFAIQKVDSSIYLAGTFGFGQIVKDVYGNLQFSQLSDSSHFSGPVTQLVAHGSSLAMTDGATIRIYEPAGQSWDSVETPGHVVRLSNFNGNLLALNPDTTLVVRGTSQLPSGFESNGPWVSWVSSDAGTMVGVNTRNELYLVRDNAVSLLNIDDDGYLAESKVVALQWAGPGLLAVGTLKGGVVFVDPFQQKIDQIVNYHTGLPDNETQVLFWDKNAGLWVAHPQGYTRISPAVPFKSYNFYPGLEGTLNTSLSFGGSVFAGTNLGLYYLDRVENFEEVVYYIRKNQSAQQVEDERRQEKKDEGGLLSFFKFNRGEEKSAASPPEEAAPGDEAADEKKKNRFSFLKKNKKQQPDAALAEATSENRTASKPGASNAQTKEVPRATRPKPVMERKVKKELQSITYVYKKIPGVEGRINQLVALNDNQLLAGGLAGAFVVEGQAATKIYAEATRRIYYSPAKDLILISPYDGSLLALRKEDGKWSESVLLEELDDFIQHIFEDRDGKIWLCTARKIYWIQLEETTLADAGEIALKNDYFDPVAGVDDSKAGLVFMHTKGFFKLNGGTLEAAEVEGMKVPEQYVPAGRSMLVSDGRSWYRLGLDLEENASMPFLRLFDHVVSVDFEKDGDLWVVAADNNFYRIDHTKNFAVDYQPFLTQIRSVNNQLLPIGDKLTVEEENSSLSFFFNQAEFSGILQVEYRYRLLGLSDEWSEWSPDNRAIQFSYLPPDSYQLQVETRNSLGTVKALESVYFSVVPPYWQRPWFYAAEVLLLAILLVISSRLTRTERTYLLVVHRLLTFLTIIMVIEFIQTLVEAKFETNASPVLSFFLQVAVAFCLLPLESFMRKRLSARNSKVDELVESHVSKIKRTITKSKMKEEELLEG